MKFNLLVLFFAVALIDNSNAQCDSFYNQIITYDASNENICDGIIISNLSGGNPPYIYNWNGEIGDYVEYVCPGNNILNVTDANNCQIIDTIFVGPGIYGCLDENACNYNSLANLDDLSCIYSDNIFDCFGNCINDEDDDGVCDELEVFGCTDLNSPNYDFLATENDGSCIECNLSVDYVVNETSNNIECDGLIAMIIQSQTNYSIEFNGSLINNDFIAEVCYGENTIIIQNELDCQIIDTIFVNANDIYGCTNFLSSNYNEDATFDDGTCILNSIITSTTNPYDSPAYLIDSILLGESIVATNHNYQGNSRQIGYFNGVNSIIGIDDGVIMSTGDINEIVPGATLLGPITNGVDNPDLLDLTNTVPDLIGQNFNVTSVNNVAILEFDFVPISSYLSFKYVFASEEYFAYENTQFNDVFGFFISGPNIVGPYSSPPGFPNGSINIATFESTELNSLGVDLPITISSVNSSYNPALFVSNQSINGANTISSYVDGFTTVITAEADVLCGATYHIRLAIADGTDTGGSSYVLLEPGSFGFDNSTCNLLGCTDPLAINFNSIATEDDGSCEYSVVDVPCAIVPTGLFVDDIIHNRVVFNWSVPSATPSHYMIRYRPVGTNQWTVMTAGPVNNNPFDGTSRTRYFMEPETTYEWNIRARVLNEDGSTNCQSPWSASSQFTTLPACPNLENLFVSTEANWVTFIADAPSEEWGVWQSKAKMKEMETNSFRYANGDSDGNINVLKGNFSPNTEYQWHTKAWCTGNVDESGNSDPQYHSGWGEFSSFTTEEICDKIPLNLTTSSNVANTAITMSWDLPLSGTPDHYFLELNNDNTGQQWQWNNIAGDQTSKSKFGLTAGDYSWKIRGACGINGTSWATIFTQPVIYTLGSAKLASEELSQLDVYPNPSRGEFNISFDLESRQDVYLIINNYLGEVVFTEELEEQEGQYNKTIDLGNKANGIYMLNITTNNQNINQKIVIQ